MTRANLTDRAPILEIEALRSGYGDLMVLHGVDLALHSQERMAILGPNGAGKTTFMRTVAGALPIASGRVRVAGEDLTRASSHKRLAHIGWVPEGRLLFDEFTVYDNLAISARVVGAQDHFDEALAQCIELFPAIGEKLKVRAGTLSGGQQQMVAIARALVRRPKILMLDEPSMGLAPRVLTMISDALHRLAADGLSIIVTEQNVTWLEGVIENVVIFGNGVVKDKGTSALLTDRDALRSIYLGV